MGIFTGDASMFQGDPSETGALIPVRHDRIRAAAPNSTEVPNARATPHAAAGRSFSNLRASSAVASGVISSPDSQSNAQPPVARA